MDRHRKDVGPATNYSCEEFCMTHARASASNSSGRSKTVPFVGDHSRLLLTEGTILTTLGAAAILVPAFSGMATVLLLGWLLLIGGIAGFVTSLNDYRMRGAYWSLLSALVALIVGMLLLRSSAIGEVSVTFVLAAFLFVDGVLAIAFATGHRNQPSSYWKWLFANGVLDLLLAIVIFWVFPGSVAWGLIVGVAMLVGGSSLVALALAARVPLATPQRRLEYVEAYRQKVDRGVASPSMRETQQHNA